MTTILIGVPFVLAQNIVYATPTRQCNAFVSPTAAIIQLSMDQSVWIAQTVTEGRLPLAAGSFIRCTDAAGATIVFKAT